MELRPGTLVMCVDCGFNGCFPASSHRKEVIGLIIRPNPVDEHHREASFQVRVLHPPMNLPVNMNIRKEDLIGLVQTSPGDSNPLLDHMDDVILTLVGRNRDLENRVGDSEKKIQDLERQIKCLQKEVTYHQERAEAL